MEDAQWEWVGKPAYNISPAILRFIIINAQKLDGIQLMVSI